MKYVFLLLAFASYRFTFSQNNSTRYLDSLFAEVEVKTYDYFQKPNETLGMDVYTPKGDVAVNRPVLLYVHGGGFAGGQRDEFRYTQFLDKMAKKGYVGVTISYTLHMKGKSFSCDQLASVKIQTFLKTAQDINRATKYLRENSKELGINPNQIILLGSSAGAEGILHAAYWRESFIGKEGDILPNNFHYAGVVSMAGALVDLSFITPESAIPTQLFHGTCDNLVPYAEASHHYCKVGESGYLTLQGGYAIAEHLKKLGKGYYLVTGCNGGHEWNDKPLFEHITDISDFVYHDVLKESIRQIHHILPSNRADCPQFYEVNFCKE